MILLIWILSVISLRIYFKVKINKYNNFFNAIYICIIRFIIVITLTQWILFLPSVFMRHFHFIFYLQLHTVN